MVKIPTEYEDEEALMEEEMPADPGLPMEGELDDDEAMAADMEELAAAADRGEQFETDAFFSDVPTGEDMAGADPELPMSEEDAQALMLALQQMG